jgi:hypothetical protein
VFVKIDNWAKQGQQKVAADLAEADTVTGQDD